MTSDRWKQIDRLFHAALEIEPSQRSGFLDQSCGGDKAMCREVEALLAAHERAASFLVSPAVEMVAKGMAEDQAESTVLIPSKHPSHSMIGQIISHYRILEKLGEGGMGVVFKAEDTRLRRLVALKFLRTDVLESEGHQARFLREAQAAAALDHPNICTVHEIGEADGETFLAMAYIEGATVRDKVKERPLKLEEAVDIAIQTGEGLQAAHQRGIIHRDIKSANLMVTREGRVKVMDFGLAQVADQTRLTKPDTILGTPACMSPEQVQRQPTDRRTDIWSLGVVIYEMVTARLPFEGKNTQAVLYSIVHEAHEPITAIRAGVPLELDRIVGKALAKVPAERYQHMDEMLVDLRALRKASLQGFPQIAPRPARQRILLAAEPSSDLHEIAGKERRAGIGGQAGTMMRDMLDKGLLRSSKKFKMTIGVLALALVSVSTYAAWTIQNFKKQKTQIDLEIAQLETEIKSAEDPGRIDDLVEELNGYQQQALSVQKSLLYRLGVRSKELDFIESEIKKVLREFGAEEYSIPKEFSEQVRRFVRQYQDSDRAPIERALNQSRKDLDAVRNQLEKDNLPPDLAYIVLIESHFDEGNTGPAGTTGLWQFTPLTARKYGLKVGDEIDERLDARKSTQAAGRYLRELILDFGSGSSVMLAIAAYSLGPDKVKRAVRIVSDPIKQRNFWYLYRAKALPTETREYVAQTIAAIIIGQNPKKFGFS